MDEHLRNRYEMAMFDAMNTLYGIGQSSEPEDVRAAGRQLFANANFGEALVGYMLACGRAIVAGEAEQRRLEAALFESGDVADTIGLVDYGALVRETHHLYGDIVSSGDLNEGMARTRFRLFEDTIKEVLESLMAAMCHMIDDKVEKLPEEYALTVLDNTIDHMKKLALETIERIRAKYGVDINPGSREADDNLYQNTIDKIDRTIDEFEDSGGNSFSNVTGRIMKVVVAWSFVATEVNIGRADNSFLEEANLTLQAIGLPADFVDKAAVHDENELKDKQERKAMGSVDGSLKELREALSAIFGDKLASVADDQLGDVLSENVNDTKALIDEINQLLNDPDINLKPSDLGL